MNTWFSTSRTSCPQTQFDYQGWAGLLSLIQNAFHNSGVFFPQTDTTVWDHFFQYPGTHCDTFDSPLSPFPDCGCAPPEQTDPKRSALLKTLNENPDFSAFRDALKDTGVDQELEQELAQDGKALAIIPTKAALDKALADNPELKNNPGLLSRVLSYHISGDVVKAPQDETQKVNINASGGPDGTSLTFENGNIILKNKDAVVDNSTQLVTLKDGSQYLVTDAVLVPPDVQEALAAIRAKK